MNKYGLMPRLAFEMAFCSVIGCKPAVQQPMNLPGDGTVQEDSSALAGTTTEQPPDRFPFPSALLNC